MYLEIVIIWYLIFCQWIDDICSWSEIIAIGAILFHDGQNIYRLAAKCNLKKNCKSAGHIIIRVLVKNIKY
jgi:hypothetical protein